MHYQQTHECLASKPHKQKLLKTLDAAKATGMMGEEEKQQIWQAASWWAIRLKSEEARESQLKALSTCWTLQKKQIKTKFF